MSTAFLILCHTPPHHVALLAARNPDARFYLHYDAQSSLSELDFLCGLNNVAILTERVAVRWGGFSMIEATLLLFQAALKDEENQSFHLISGHCAPLQSAARLAQLCAAAPHNALWLDSAITPRLRYRTRFRAPHADTPWQRKLAGKLLTKSLQLLDKILPCDDVCVAGSQWFSANRSALQTLYHAAQGAISDEFRQSLCPDEHFFQTIALRRQPEMFHLIRHHQRWIRFAAGKNHPDWLSLTDLQNAQKQGAWFARKVSAQVMADFLRSTP